MKIIVVRDPAAAKLLESLLGLVGELDKMEGFAESPGQFMKTVTGRITSEQPDLKTNPDFYTKPEVPKALVLKVKSNTTEGKTYDVTQDRVGNLFCTCQGFKYRGKCSHIKKVSDAVAEGCGLGLCLRCGNFTRSEVDITSRGKKGCTHHDTISCPPMSTCKHFNYLYSMKFEKQTKKEYPMTFPVEGTLLQTFQSRHFPEVTYEVKMKDGDLVCTCRGFNFHGSCKHVQYMKQRVNQGTIRI